MGGIYSSMHVLVLHLESQNPRFLCWPGFEQCPASCALHAAWDRLTRKTCHFVSPYLQRRELWTLFAPKFLGKIWENGVVSRLYQPTLVGFFNTFSGNVETIPSNMPATYPGKLHLPCCSFCCLPQGVASTAWRYMLHDVPWRDKGWCRGAVYPIGSNVEAL